MLRALFCVLAAFFRAAAALRQVLIFHKIQNLEDDHMGFHYAREKKKFDAEWAKTAAWYKAEGMPDEDIEAMRRFDWAEFCSRRAYENRTQPLPEETIEADSASTLFQKFEQLTTSLDAETFSGRSDWIEQIEDGALAGRLKQLSPDGISSPMRYKQKNGCSRERWPSIHESNFWTKGVLYKILRDERYLGTAVYGKRERDMVGLVHSVKKTRADWITVEAAHEGIIEPKLFQAAQAELKAFSEKDSPAPNANPLRRKVICGCCGYAMQLVKAKAPYYRCCSAELGLPYGCKTESVSQTDIQDAVLALIRAYAQCAVDLDRLQAEQRQRIRQAQKQAEKALTALQNRRQQLVPLLQNLYEQLIDGSTDREAYLAQKQKITAQLQELAEKEAELKAAASVSGADTFPILERYRQYTELDTLTPAIAKELVQRVVVHPDNRLEVQLTHCPPNIRPYASLRPAARRRLRRPRASL